MADLLCVDADGIDRIAGEHLDEDVRAAWQASANMLHAALAGVEMGKREGDAPTTPRSTDP
ncbi:MAG: hypothetical protein Q8S13_05940 [Dehalococcoidia bacterium]|nr:hypothetical protein [Dehalococcoidia bacterium]